MSVFNYISLLSPHVMLFSCLLLSFGFWGNLYRVAFCNKRSKEIVDLSSVYPSLFFLRSSLFFYALFYVFFFPEELDRPLFDLSIIFAPVASLGGLYWARHKKLTFAHDFSSLAKEPVRYLLLALCSYVSLALIGTVVNVVFKDELVLHNTFVNFHHSGMCNDPMSWFRQPFHEYPVFTISLMALYFTLPFLFLRSMLKVFSLQFLAFFSVSLSLFLVSIIYKPVLAFPDYPPHFNFSGLSFPVIAKLVIVSGFFYLWHFSAQRNHLGERVSDLSRATEKHAPSVVGVLLNAFSVSKGHVSPVIYFLLRTHIIQIIVISILALMEMHSFFETAFPCSHETWGFCNKSTGYDVWLGDFISMPYPEEGRELFFKMSGVIQSILHIFVLFALALWSYVHVSVFTRPKEEFAKNLRIVPSRSTLKFGFFILLSLSICLFVMAAFLPFLKDKAILDIQVAAVTLLLWGVPVGLYRFLTRSITLPDNMSLKDKTSEVLNFLAVPCLLVLVLRCLFVYMPVRVGMNLVSFLLLGFYIFYLAAPFFVLFRKSLKGQRWRCARSLIVIFTLTIVFLIFGIVALEMTHVSMGIAQTIFSSAI